MDCVNLLTVWGYELEFQRIDASDDVGTRPEHADS